jgi:hypothetical protein
MVGLSYWLQEGRLALRSGLPDKEISVLRFENMLLEFFFFKLRKRIAHPFSCRD